MIHIDVPFRHIHTCKGVTLHISLALVEECLKGVKVSWNNTKITIGYEGESETESKH